MSFQLTTSPEPAHSRKRKYSDISGPNLERPAKRSRYIDDEEETSMWPTVKLFLEDPARRPQPFVACPICMVPIAIRGVPILEPDPWRLSAGLQEIGFVLCCGHITCQVCINQHIAAQEEMSPNGDKTCPCCRAHLHFMNCFHVIPPQRVPIATGETWSLVPLTRPELAPGFEHRFPDYCYDCTERGIEEFIETGLDFVSGLIHGAQYQQHKFTREWDDLVESSLELFCIYLQDQHAVPSYRNGHIPVALLRVSFADEVVHAVQEMTYPGGDGLVYTRDGEFLWRVPNRRSDGSYLSAGAATCRPQTW